MKKTKFRRALAALLAVIMVFMLAACGGGAKTANNDAGSTDATPPPAATTDTDTATVSEDEDITIAYFALTMVSAWLQNINKALTALGEEKGFKVVNFDADFDADKQMSQLDTMTAQGIDGAVVFVANEGMGPAVAQKCADMGIPLIAETLRIEDSDGKLLAPVVELDAKGVGATGADWMIANFEKEGFDKSNLAKTGYIALTNSNQTSSANRVIGFEEVFFGEFKDWPASSKFVADVAADATSSDDTDATYKLVSAILGAHPEMERWLIFSAYDDLGVGACRADEAANLEDVTCLVDIGGERGIPEWQAGNAPEWRACVYFNAMEFAEPIVEAMLDMIKTGKPGTDVFPDKKEPGQNYAAIRITGTAVTPETYQEIYLEGY